MMDNRFFGQALVYVLSSYAVAAVPFLLLPILTRVLDPAAYGIVAMFMVAVAFMSVAVGLNTHGAIGIRYFDRAHFEIRQYISTSLAILLFSTMFMLGVVFFAGELITTFISIPKTWLYIAVVVSALQIIVQVLLTIWQVSKKPVRFAIFRCSHALVEGALSLIFVLVLTLSWQGRLSAIVIAWLTAGCFALVILIRAGWVAKSVSLSCAKDALGYGVPLIPHALGGLLLGMVDRIMVTAVLDITAAGIYVVALQLGLTLGLFADAFNKAFAPWLMEKLTNMDSHAQEKIVVLTYLYFIAVVLMSIFGAALASNLLPFIAGPEFQAVEPLLIYIFLGNAFTGMYYMVTNYVFYARKTGILSLLTVIVGAISIVLSWGLINQFGVIGAAMGFMLGQAALFLGTWYISSQCIPMPWVGALRLSSIRR